MANVLYYEDIQLVDTIKAEFGTSSDLKIYHDSSSSYIENNTGNMNIMQRTNDADMVFTCDDGSGGDTEYFKLDGTNHRVKFSKNSVHTDGVKALFGDSLDLQIYHDGSHSYIQDSGTGVLKILSSGVTFQNEAGSSNILVLDSSGNATFAGKVVTTEVESSGTLLLDATADITIDAGGQDIILSDDGTIFATLSNSSGFQIRSRVNDADMFFRGVDGGTEFNALTLDMSEGGAATFSDNITLNSRITFDYNGSGTGNNYIETGTNSIAFKNSSGSSTLALGFADQSATFYGIVAIPSYIYHLSDPSDDTYFGFNGNDNFTVVTAGGSGLVIDSNRNATFTGDITLGANHIGRDGDNYIGFATDNLIKFRVNGATQVKLSDGVFAPQTDSDVDLGSNGTRFANLYVDNINGATPVSGSGTIERLAKWSGSGTLSNSIITDDGSGVSVAGDVFIPEYIYHTGDTNTYFGFPSNNDTIVFATNGSTALTLNGANAATFTGDLQAPGIYVGATNTSYDFYNNGTSYFNGAVTIDDTFTQSGGGASTFSGDVTVGDELTITTIGNATADPDKFLCASGSNKVGYRTGAQVLSDIGAAPATGGAYLPLAGGTMTGNVIFNDSVKALFGTSSDLQIQHNGSTSYIQNYTGNLNIENQADDGDIIFKCDDGSGGVTQYYRIDGGASLNVFSEDIFLADNKKALFGSNSDLQIYHDSSNSYISDTGTGNLIITGSSNIQLKSAASEFYMIGIADAEVRLYYNNAEKFKTTNTGAAITGIVTTSLGTKADPSYTFSGDDNTGMYSDSADSISFTTGGSNILTLNVTSGLAKVFGDLEATGKITSDSVAYAPFSINRGIQNNPFGNNPGNAIKLFNLVGSSAAGSAPSSAGGDTYWVAPGAGRIRSITVRNVKDTPTSGNTRFKIYKNGANTYTSSYITPTSGGSVGQSVQLSDIDESFANLDRVQIGFQGETSTTNWGSCGLTIVYELSDYSFN